MSKDTISSLASLLLAAACSVPAPKPGATGGIESAALAEIDADWFRSVLGSDMFRRYLDIPAGSVHLDRFAHGTLTRMAMVESFLRDPDWRRIWYVAGREPDEFSGLAVLNHLARENRGEFVSFDLAEIGQDADPRGFEAAIFAHLRDEPSQPSPFDPLDWIRGFYHHNAYWTCAKWLASRNQGYMVGEWSRIAQFKRNLAIGAMAASCVEQSSGSEGSEAFSISVGAARALQRQYLGQRLLDASIYDVRGDGKEVRRFEIRFFGKQEAVGHYVWSMTAIRPKFVNHEVKLFVRIPKWPHVVTMEGGRRDLDQIQELFDLLEKGEPGEVRREYSTYLVVRGRYSSTLESSLPPYTRLGLVPGQGLVVVSVLNENLEEVQRWLNAR